MNVRKIIRKRIRHEGPATQVAADINAVVAANVNEPGSRTRVSSRQRVSQRQGPHRKDDVTEGGDDNGREGRVPPRDEGGAPADRR